MPNLIEIFFSECSLNIGLFLIYLIICNTSLFYDWFVQRLHNRLLLCHKKNIPQNVNLFSLIKQAYIKNKMEI